MGSKVTALLMAVITATIMINLPQYVLSQPSNLGIQKNYAGPVSAKAQSFYNATDDYYNKYYINTLINSTGNTTLSNANVSEWKIDLSNNGWTFAQSWREVIGNTSNVLARYSDNGGKNYTQTFNVCPGGIDKRTGVYGPEFWVLCVKPTPSGHNNVYLVETRTGRTPLKSLTNLSQNKTSDSTILDFAVNDITGGVSAAWFESPMKSNHNAASNVHLGGGPVITYCYRC